jgi:hypothetical protein
VVPQEHKQTDSLKYVLPLGNFTQQPNFNFSDAPLNSAKKAQGKSLN